MRILSALLLATFSSAALTAAAEATPIVQLRASAVGFSDMLLVNTTAGNLFSTGTVNFAGYSFSVNGYGDASQLSYTVQVAPISGTLPNLVLAITEYDLVAPNTGAVQLKSYSSGNLASSSSVKFDTYFDDGDAAFGTTTSFYTATATGPASSFATTPQVAIIPVSGTFSVTKTSTLTPVSGGIPTYSPQLYLTYVPEPASMALLGAGLIGLGLARRRRG